MSEPLAAPEAPATPSLVPSPVAASPTATAMPPAVQPPAPAVPTPAPQADDKQEPHWLPDRLRRNAEAERKALLKELGIEDPKDAKKALAEYKAQKEAEKSELQRALEKASALEKAAGERDVYRAKVESWAKAEFEGLSEQQKTAIERIAGDDPLKRAEAIELLRPTWAAAATPSAPVVVSPAAPPAAPPVPAPVTNAPPAAIPRPGAQQSPWEKYQQIESEQGPVAASLFYQFNSRDIEISRPIA